MKKLLRWLALIDNNILKVALGFFIFLIPLYPKLPLRHVEYTYISIRADDLFIAVLCILFLIQLIRRKITLNKTMLLPILIFWAAVFTSFVWSNYIVKTMPYHQVALLHALRRIEYMVVFFIASSLVKSRRDFEFYVYTFLSSIALICAYAFGQKFIGFPAVQTMNPAFAQGLILILTPEARISATFAGHYDLATFFVLLTPLLLGIHFSERFFTLKKWERIMVYVIGFLSTVYTVTNLHIVTNAWAVIILTALPLLILYATRKEKLEKWVIFGFVMLSISVIIFTASRISFLAFVLSTPLFALFMKKYKYFVFLVLFTVALMSTSRSLSNRLSKTFQVKQILVNDQTGQVYVPQEITAKELPAGSAYINLNKKRPETKESTLYKERILRDATASGHVLSDKERTDILATLSANIKPVSSIVADISFATRLQVEWPRAIGALLKNPLLGTGPFSITEATDNDYLRWLGEFGLFGFLSFLTIIALTLKRIFIASRKNAELRPIYIGIIFGVLGLLMNASYIDVFEASKVAYMFWCLMGLSIGSITNHSHNS